jgi:transposase
MLSISGNENVYLACGSTDMRRSIDGLAAIVQQCFSLDPFSKNLFVFCNKNRSMIKILHWDHNGFWLYMKLFRSRSNFMYSQNPEPSHLRIFSIDLFLLPKANMHLE